VHLCGLPASKRQVEPVAVFEADVGCSHDSQDRVCIALTRHKSTKRGCGRTLVYDGSGMGDGGWFKGAAATARTTHFMAAIVITAPTLPPATTGKLRLRFTVMLEPDNMLHRGFIIEPPYDAGGMEDANPHLHGDTVLYAEVSLCLFLQNARCHYLQFLGVCTHPPARPSYCCTMGAPEMVARRVILQSISHVCASWSPHPHSRCARCATTHNRGC
jgi:hypothetical protein